MTDCRDCKSWKKCVAPPEWFNFLEIRWCPFQVIFILTHRETLLSGHWPQDPYRQDDNVGKKVFKTEASFVKPEVVIAELETRLECCGKQAELLITQIEDGRTLSNLSDGAQEVLMYVKGFRRKRVGFSKWVREVYHQKTGEKGQFLSKKMRIST